MLHNALRSLVIATSLCSLYAQVPSGMTAPCDNIPCEIRVDWLRNNGMVTSAAAAMPPEKFGFKPTPEQQTFGERVLHVASVNLAILQSLGAKTPAPTINEKATAKDEILASLAKVTEYGTAVLTELKPEQLTTQCPSPEVMAWFMGPNLTPQRAVYFLMAHAQDTYGQLVVYLRLSGIVPPLSRQP
jgi:uncharacterized damage-inducible protein DinB